MKKLFFVILIFGCLSVLLLLFEKKEISGNFENSLSEKEEQSLLPREDASTLKKVEFIKTSLPLDPQKGLSGMSNDEILSKYSTYLHFNKTWSLDADEKSQVLMRVKSKQCRVTYLQTLSEEYHIQEQTCSWALSVLYRSFSYSVDTIPNICIEDDNFFYMWNKGRPEYGKMLEKKTFKIYAWKF